MSTMQRRIQNFVVRTVLNPNVISAQRYIYRTKRIWMGGGTRVVDYFHQVDDPYSHLASQVLEKFIQRYDVDLKVHLVNPPNDENTPDRQRLFKYARRDAALIAPYYKGVCFSNPEAQPPNHDCAVASEILAAHLLDPELFSKVAPRVGRALWAFDDKNESMDSLVGTLPKASEQETQQVLEHGTRRREELGHYSSAMFYFEGEWYWGLDRLPHLEERLVQDGACKEVVDDSDKVGKQRDLIVPFQDMPDLSLVPNQDGKPSMPIQNQITLEYYVSVRSPYSCISIGRTLNMVRRFEPHVKLEIKPVLPMVMRGAAVPKSKRIYIVRDTHREAARWNISFGNLYDPLGQPIQDFFSFFYPYTVTEGCEAELLRNFVEGSFCRGVDTATPQGLEQVVTESGLDWDRAQLALEKQQNDWSKLPERNLQDMLDAGLWGVPSFRIRSQGQDDFAIWGQDRIWLVKKEIQRRLET